MKKNTLLNIAIIICYGLRLLLVIFSIIVLGLFIYVQVDKEKFKDQEIQLSQSTKIMNHYVSDSSNSKAITIDNNLYTLGELKTVSLYLMFLEWIITIALIYLGIKEFQKVMASVRTLRTFARSSIKSFRRIGIYALIFFIITNHYILWFEGEAKIELSISFIPLIYALLAFIMAEIFKEGNALKQENDLTI